MTAKTVSQLDAEGYFIGPATADESPLEPGVFHLPAGAADAPPPVVPEGQRAKWIDGEFVLEDIPVPPPEPEPTPEELPPAQVTQVTMRQARLALLAAGLLDTIDSAIREMPGTAGIAARIEWEYAATIDRDNLLFAALTTQIGITDEQLDALFTQASQL
jgi:hypothetical protein